MPIVKLLIDYRPEWSDRTRKAGRTMNVTQDGARQMIADGIAEESPNLYGLPAVTSADETPKKTAKKKKTDPEATPAPVE